MRKKQASHRSDSKPVQRQPQASRLTSTYTSHRAASRSTMASRPAKKWLRSNGRRALQTVKILAVETEPPRSLAYPWLRSNGKGHLFAWIAFWHGGLGRAQGIPGQAARSAARHLHAIPHARGGRGQAAAFHDQAGAVGRRHR